MNFQFLNFSSCNIFYQVTVICLTLYLHLKHNSWDFTIYNLTCLVKLWEYYALTPALYLTYVFFALYLSCKVSSENEQTMHLYQHIGISSFQNWLIHLFSSTLVSISKEVLWVVVMKCKTVLFLNFWVCDTFSWLVLIQSTQSFNNVCIYKIHAIDEEFFFSANVTMIIEKVSLSFFHDKHC